MNVGLLMTASSGDRRQYGVAGDGAPPVVAGEPAERPERDDRKTKIPMMTTSLSAVPNVVLRPFDEPWGEMSRMLSPTATTGHSRIPSTPATK